MEPALRSLRLFHRPKMRIIYIVSPSLIFTAFQIIMFINPTIGMSTQAYPIYTGTWTNWSHGSALGATLTLNHREGAFLVAFIALFVNFVGNCFWRVLCILFHWAYSLETPQDGIYHQRQAILKNSGSSLAGTWSFAKMLWRWRKNNIQRPVARILPVLVLSTCTVLGFAAAGILSSRIAFSSVTGSEVLLSSPFCGYATPEGLTLDVLLQQAVPYVGQRMSLYTNYAVNCYLAGSNSVGVDCNLFTANRLNSAVTISRNASCPFDDPTICRSQDRNIFIDTGYINTDLHLGLNAPESKRYLFRMTTHCAPLATENHTDALQFKDPDLGINLNYTSYNYGSYVLFGRGLKSYTFLKRVEPPRQIYFENGASTRGEYRLRGYENFIANGSFSEDEDWIPSDAFKRSNADIGLFFLSSDSIRHTGEVKDEWYAASQAMGNMLSPDGRTDGPVYIADNPGSPLACATQYQTCPVTKDQCGPLGSMQDFVTHQPNESEEQYEMKMWLAKRFLRYNLSSFIDALGQRVLASTDTLSGGFQVQLPDNQWQIDVERWNSILLAAWQGSLVDGAIGPPDHKLLENSVWELPAKDDKVGNYVCQNQKIRSTAHANFSILGLSITFAIGLFIIALNYTLEPLMDWVNNRPHPRTNPARQYAWLEWYTNGTLQLQRLAHEQLGVGDWVNCNGTVPRTESNSFLAVLDIKDPKHPILANLPSVSTSSNAVSSVEQEDGKPPTSQPEGVVNGSESHDQPAVTVQDNTVGNRHFESRSDMDERDSEREYEGDILSRSSILSRERPVSNSSALSGHLNCASRDEDESTRVEAPERLSCDYNNRM